MAHLRSASPLLWMALLITCTTIHVWGPTHAVNRTLLHTLARVYSCRQHLPTPKHMLYLSIFTCRLPAACLPPLSTNVFCCISMKITVGEQDGIPHILQRYLRTSRSLSLSLSYSLAHSSLPSWGHDLCYEKTNFFIKL